MTALARVSPGTTPDRWEVRVPGSKSITNRALLVAGVADGVSTVIEPLLADDTLVMIEALRELGVGVAPAPDPERAASALTVDGLGAAPSGPASVWCGMAGTVGRFLVPLLAAGEGTFEVDAHAQLRRRPLGPVLRALSAQGAEIEGDTLPLKITAHGLAGGEVDVDTSVSSQFLSGLLMAAPLARTATTLRFDTLVSRPYLDLTLDVMRAFGVDPVLDEHAIHVRPHPYRATGFEVEPDVSTASYFLACAAVTGTTVVLPGLDLSATRQGDIEFVEFLTRMGATVISGSPLTLTGPAQLRGVTVDMGNSSDVFMTLACIAPFAEGPTTIEGIGHARVKESDRIAATAENLRRLGISVDEGQDSLTIHPGMPTQARLPTYDDHRIAMAFSLIGTHAAVELEDPGVVAKTCPSFFELWPSTGAVVQLEDEEPAPEGEMS